MSNALLMPIAPGERMEVLDVLRGFALLGILLMNIEALAGPMNEAMSGVNPKLTGIDRSVDLLIYFFVQGKFYTLFSLLFGMGFAVMSQRAAVSGRAFAGIYWRRSLVLLGIGLVHAIFIWAGDILVTYALVSFLLLAFRQLRGKWLVALAIASFIVPLGMMLAFGAVGSFMQSHPELAAEWQKAMAEQSAMGPALVEAQRVAYGSGTYLQATMQRLSDFGHLLAALMIVGPLVLSMFLLGSWFVSSGAIADPLRFSRLFWRLRWLALPIGLILMATSVWMQPTLEQAEVNLTFSIAFCFSMLGSGLMCLGYAAWVIRGLQSPRAAGWLQPLAPAGRMALTNYLGQSLVCTLVFYGYGLAYFEQLSRAWQVPFVLVLFALQVLFSTLWLRRFRFGPMEWLWRSLTYLKWQPMRYPLASRSG